MSIRDQILDVVTRGVNRLDGIVDVVASWMGASSHSSHSVPACAPGAANGGRKPMRFSPLFMGRFGVGTRRRLWAYGLAPTARLGAGPRWTDFAER